MSRRGFETPKALANVSRGFETPKALANVSAGFELARTLGRKGKKITKR